MIKYNSKKFKGYKKQDVMELIKALDSYFVPPLSERVNLKDYVNKLDQYANMILAYNENKELVGIIAFYDNDDNSKVAFISILGVRMEYQGQGIATKLVDKCLEKCRLADMEKIIVKTEAHNSEAKRLYDRIGFCEVEQFHESDVEKIKLKLDLLLI